MTIIILGWLSLSTAVSARAQGEVLRRGQKWASALLEAEKGVTPVPRLCLRECGAELGGDMQSHGTYAGSGGLGVKKGKRVMMSFFSSVSEAAFCSFFKKQ